MKKYFLATSLGIISPIGFILSCSNESKSNDYISFDKLNGFKNLIANYKYKDKSILKAKVTSWKDGDTISYEYWDPLINKWVSNKGGVPLSLRIGFIDTPEYHDPSASDPQKRGDLTNKEIEWAKYATDWAKKEIPEGSEIRIWKTGTDAYSRTIGNIFYNKNSEMGFNNNFSVNIIRKGYTFPRLDNKGDILLAMGDETEILNYLALPLYSSWHEAKKNKIGLFGLSESELINVYKKHGIPNNKLDILKNLKNKWLNEPTFKKYKIYK